jgi:hypothetical protein
MPKRLAIWNVSGTSWVVKSGRQTVRNWTEERTISRLPLIRIGAGGITLSLEVIDNSIHFQFKNCVLPPKLPYAAPSLRLASIRRCKHCWTSASNQPTARQPSTELRASFEVSEIAVSVTPPLSLSHIRPSLRRRLPLFSENLKR